MAEELALIFRFNENGQGPDIVQQVLLERGWIEFEEDAHEEHEWNFWWKASRFRQSEYDKLLPWQRLNHYPKTTALTKKDSLARNLKRMKGIYGASLYNFSPLCYNLPNDYKKFVADYTKKKQRDPEKLQLWICKPADMSRGRGIFIFKDLSELQYDCCAVLQKYLTNPLLIAGYKFDLRIYVCVTSFHPLGIYIYQEGIVRFSTEKFDLTNLSNVFSHLTNTSINKFGPSYTTDKERVGPGCKWSITQLRHYFRQNEIDDRVLWCKIKSLVILTILAQANQVPKAANCYELFGFDIIIDENMKPWLLEVNFSPALSIDCATDIITKKPMLHDLFDLLNFSAIDCDRGGKNFKFSPTNKPADYYLSAHRPVVAKTRKAPGKVSKAKVEKVEETSSKDNLSETDSGEEGPVELLVPGCGLPSVQMLKSRQSMSSSSGCSSAGSFGVNHDSQTNNSQTKTPLCKSPSKNARPNGTPVKESHIMKENSSASSKEMNETKYVKEISTVSDSAVSGLSSENSDVGADNDKLAQVKLAEKKCKILSRSVATMQSCNDKHTSIYSPSPTAASKSFVNPCSTGTGKLSSKQNGSKNSLQNGASSNLRGRKLSEPCPQISRPPPLVRHNTQPSGFSPNRSVLKPKHALLPQRQRASNGLSPVTTSLSTPKSFIKYASTKPDAHAINSFKPNPMYPTMQQRVGDYFLVFPFNEQMRKMGTNLDIRIVSREVQRMVKAKMNEVKGTGDLEDVFDLPQLWPPVRAPEDEIPANGATGVFGSFNMKPQ